MKNVIKLSSLFFCLSLSFTVNATSQSAAKLDTTPPPANGALSTEQTPPISMTQSVNEENADGNKDESDDNMRESAKNFNNQEAVANTNNENAIATASAEAVEADDLDPEVIGATASSADAVSVDSITYSDAPYPA